MPSRQRLAQSSFDPSDTTPRLATTFQPCNWYTHAHHDDSFRQMAARCQRYQMLEPGHSTAGHKLRPKTNGRHFTGTCREAWMYRSRYLCAKVHQQGRSLLVPLATLNLADRSTPGFTCESWSMQHGHLPRPHYCILAIIALSYHPPSAGKEFQLSISAAALSVPAATEPHLDNIIRYCQQEYC